MTQPAISLNQATTLGHSFEEDLMWLSDGPYAGLGVMRRKLDDYGVQRFADWVQRTETRVTSLNWIGGFTDRDPGDFDRAIEDALQAIGDASSIGAETVTVIAGGTNMHIYRQAFRMVCEALATLAPTADQLGVSLGLEVMHPGCGPNWSFLQNLKQALDVIEHVAHPAVGLTADLYHLGLMSDTASWLSEAAKHVRLVQIGDGRLTPNGEMNRCPIGSGQIDLSTLMRLLLEADYCGPIEVELLGEDVEIFDTSDLLHHSHEKATALLRTCSR